ncbi:DUF5689 domain-containing protein [Flavobacterium sp.]
MKNLKLILTAAVFATFASCINDDAYDVPDLSGECVSIPKTKEVSDITNIATAATRQYTTDETLTDYIEAYVTSSDEGGNFYKSISMMSTDGTKGFSMPVDNYNLFNEFEPGRKVTIKLDKNRYFNLQHGSTVIGSSYNGGVGRVSGVEYKNVILRSCEDKNEDEIVKNLTIAQAKNNQYLNMLIEFDEVQFTDPSLGKKYYDASLNSIGGATNHEITDRFGNRVILRVSEFAKFAGNAVPSKNGKIRGVMTKFNNDFQFMIRTLNDVKIDEVDGIRLTIDLSPPIVGTNLNFDATLNEPFTSYTTTNQQIFPKYINDAVLGSRYWQLKTFSGNKYIEMTSFNGSGNPGLPARTLFFVPVNFDAASTFTFKKEIRFNAGQALNVYYVTAANYTPGAAVNMANFVNITTGAGFNITYPATGSSENTFTSPGTYNIPGTLTGNGYFVFEYVGSSTVTTTVQIDDIVIN